MNYTLIRSIDIANGEGIGTALFVSGCPFHCEGCFNPETWDYEYGKEFTQKTLISLIEATDKPYISRISILGGEPLVPVNLETVSLIIESLKKRFPEKRIWIYSGYTYESLNKNQLRVISKADILVDGQFIKEKKDLNLKFRGSSNQRIIDIQQTIKGSRLTLWGGELSRIKRDKIVR